MSDDRKPGRVRMVSGSGGGTAAATPVVTTTAATAPPAAPPRAKGAMKAALLPGALFLIGCIGGGVAIARLVP